MPKLSDEVREQRRRHVLVSAWKCFSRQGFHATSMDQIIAETGMSPNAVYRYFQGKEELIDAAADEALMTLRDTLQGLELLDPAPGPNELLALLIDGLRRQQSADYDMTKISIVAWGEALRRPELHDRAARFYGEALGLLERLARRWQATGTIGADADPVAVAKLYLTLMPGMMVTRHLSDPASVAELAAGMGAIALRSESAPAAPSR
jgi:AcrR family transcriptional regulator